MSILVKVKRDCTLAVCVQLRPLHLLSAYSSVLGSVISGNATSSHATSGRPPGFRMTKASEDVRMCQERRQQSVTIHRFRGGDIRRD